MILSCSVLNFRPRQARLATLVVLGAAFGLTALAQNAGSSSNPVPPYILFQNSTITGSGNTLTATRLPVFTTSGKTLYEDVVIQFDVDDSGNLTPAPGFPQITPSPTPIIGKFKAGTYVGPSNILGGKAIIVVAGPSVGTGGSTQWTLTATAGADPCTYPNSAIWDSGPLVDNPNAKRITNAGITYTSMGGFGVGGSQNNCIDPVYWDHDTLLGFSQVGNTLTISSYTYVGSTDYPNPKDQITYTRQ